jgi:formyl-CoA transferase
MKNLSNVLEQTPSLPLDGIKVIDFTQVMLGPVCTQMLADYGAEVIKFERKGSGDLLRHSLEPIGSLDNPVFCSLNRNKKSVEIDLRSEADLAAIKALIAEADVVINNFRAGVMERLGLSYEDCRAINPGIIYAFGTGFGESGPYSHKGGQDILAQAMTGLMARRADASLPYSIYPTALADYCTGMHLAQGILLALHHRARTGAGQKVGVSLYDSMLAMQTQEASMIMMADREVNWAEMPLCAVFETLDGVLTVVGAFKQNPLADICTALEIDDLSQDPRFDSAAQQMQNKPQLRALLAERFASNTSAYWLARLDEQDILCAPVKQLREALEDPQTRHNEMVIEGDYHGQTIRMIGSPINLSQAKVEVRSAPPKLGEHTAEFMARWRAPQ